MNGKSKCNCQRCGNPIEFPNDLNNLDIECPHCHKQTTLLAGSLNFVDSQTKQSPSKYQFHAKPILIAYALLVPLVVVFLMRDNGVDSGMEFTRAVPTALFVALCILGSVGIYFIPAFIAKANRKANFQAILVLNIALGWTLIGWVVAAVWACTVEPEKSNH
jgi:hypothetical protein